MFSEKKREQIKEKILEKSFELFAKKGLESTSINDIAEYCGTYKAALYSFFGSKEGLVMECSSRYLLSIDKKIIEIMDDETPTLRETLRKAFFVLTNDRNRFRFIYQVISSPNYGKAGRDKLSGIYVKYFEYSDLIAEKYNVSSEKFRPYYLLFIATVHDYCLWENTDFVIEKLNYILDRVQELEEQTIES